MLSATINLNVILSFWMLTPNIHVTNFVMWQRIYERKNEMEREGEREGERDTANPKETGKH